MPDPTILVTFMVVLLILCVLGLVGNSLNLVILIKKEMRSSTNYFLLGLTVSDILLLILSFLRTLHNIVPYLPTLTEIPSDFWGVFIHVWDWICTSGTKYFTVAVSMERCLAVCFPLRAKSWNSKRRSKIYSWTIFGFTVFLAFFTLLYKMFFKWLGFEIFVSLILQVIPFVLIVILNTAIYFGIKKFQEARKTMTNTEIKTVAITRMLLCVVLIFGFCHSFELIRLIMTYAHYFEPQYAYYDYTISYLADFFYVLNSSVNFVIYYLMVDDFRREFLKLVPACFGLIVPPSLGGSGAQTKTHHTATVTSKSTNSTSDPAV